MIPYVTFNPEAGTISLSASSTAPPPALFEMDPEQTRELIVMLVGSIVRIEGDVERIAMLFDELLSRGRDHVKRPR
jgi:hypothetical protein